VNVKKSFIIAIALSLSGSIEASAEAEMPRSPFPVYQRGDIPECFSLPTLRPEDLPNFNTLLGRVSAALVKLYSDEPEGDAYVLAQHPTAVMGWAVSGQAAKFATEKAFRNVETVEGKKGLNQNNSESDAFRHFVWGALMIKMLGVERAREFLIAHERYNFSQQKSLSTAPSTEMDYYNDEIAIQEALELEKSGNLETKAVVKRAIELINAKKLYVLKPMAKLPIKFDEKEW
jgi:hypothetical protein